MADATIHIDYTTSIHTGSDVAKKFSAWKAIHEYGPYIIRLVPTGVNTAVSIKHEKSGHEFDLTDYDSI